MVTENVIIMHTTVSDPILDKHSADGQKLFNFHWLYLLSIEIS